MSNLPDEYRLQRTDLRGSPDIYVRLDELPPVVLADHSTPEWIVDAKVCASLIGRGHFVTEPTEAPGGRERPARGRRSTGTD